MESRLDVVVNPRGAVDGANQVKAALSGMAGAARTSLTQLQDKFDAVKSAVFSVQSAVAALGFAAVARDTINLALALERSERGLFALSASAGAARVQLERIRAIGDEFQLFDDQQLANSFRLLVSHGVQNAEQALKTITNAAAMTNQDVEALTMAVLSGQERALRRIGIGLHDLGQGEVDLVFGNMEVRARKTDQAIRAGLLQLLQQGFPDATKAMGDSLEFQFKRVTDKFEDIQVAVLRGGLKDFGVALMKTVADNISDSDTQQVGEKIADGIIMGLEKIGRGAAFVIDTLTPLGNMLFGVIKRALDEFNRMPPELQTVGIIGFMFLGTAGRATLVGALALADALHIKIEDIVKAMKSSGNTLFESTPLGALAKKGAELYSGRKEHVTRPPDEGAMGTAPQSDLFGLSDLFNPQKVSTAQTAVDKFFESLHANIRKTREENTRTAQAAGGSGGGLLATGKYDENLNKITAQIEELKKQARDVRQLEADKRDVGFSQQRADAEQKARETINALERQSLSLSEDQKAIIFDIFDGIARAKEQTQAWSDSLEYNKYQWERTQSLITRSKEALIDVMNEVDVMAQPMGASRREAEIRLGMMAEIERQNLKIKPEQYEWLVKQAKVLAEQEAKLNAIKFVEERRLGTLERIAALNAETQDLGKGWSRQSLQTRMDAEMREAARRGAPLSEEQAQLRFKQIGREMDAEDVNILAKLNFQLENEQQNLEAINAVAGMRRRDREIELRFLNERNKLSQQGIALDPAEEAVLREKIQDVQAQREMARMTDAVNSFVDSFEVGWDTIARSGQSAYRVLEDGLVQFFQTGKMSFSSFAKFVQQELLRLAIRNLFSQAIGAAMPAGGIGGLFSSFFSGGGAAASTSAVGYTNFEGFATGGSFMVGGSGPTDSQLVKFRATPGERVTITTPGQSMGGGVNIGITINAGTGQQSQSGPGSQMPNYNQLAREVGKLVEAKIVDEQRPGGLLAGR